MLGKYKIESEFFCEKNDEKKIYINKESVYKGKFNNGKRKLFDDNNLIYKASCWIKADKWFKFFHYFLV